jgi:hypothetical protein
MYGYDNFYALCFPGRQDHCSARVYYYARGLFIGIATGAVGGLIMGAIVSSPGRPFCPIPIMAGAMTTTGTIGLGMASIDDPNAPDSWAPHKAILLIGFSLTVGTFVAARAFRQFCDQAGMEFGTLCILHLMSCLIGPTVGSFSYALFKTAYRIIACRLQQNSIGRVLPANDDDFMIEMTEIGRPPPPQEVAVD